MRFCLIFPAVSWMFMYLQWLESYGGNVIKNTLVGRERLVEHYIAAAFRNLGHEPGKI